MRLRLRRCRMRRRRMFIVLRRRGMVWGRIFGKPRRFLPGAILDLERSRRLLARLILARRGVRRYPQRVTTIIRLRRWLRRRAGKPQPDRQWLAGRSRPRRGRTWGTAGRITAGGVLPRRPMLGGNRPTRAVGVLLILACRIRRNPRMGGL